MKATKFIVIFNDNHKTTIYTNDLEKSKLFTELSKKYSYKLIEMSLQKTEEEKQEKESTKQFAFNPFIVAIYREWQETLLKIKEWDKEYCKQRGLKIAQFNN